MKNFYKKGFTLIEALIVIAIIGILVAIALPNFSKMRNTQIIKGVSEDVVSVLNKARSQTLASLNSQKYGVHFETNKIVLFSNTNMVYNVNDASNEIVTISSPVTISSISLTGGAIDVYFNRLNGAPSKTGTIVVSGTGLTKTITISATGGISVN